MDYSNKKTVEDIDVAGKRVPGPLRLQRPHRCRGQDLRAPSASTRRIADHPRTSSTTRRPRHPLLPPGHARRASASPSCSLQLPWPTCLTEAARSGPSRWPRTSSARMREEQRRCPAGRRGRCCWRTSASTKERGRRTIPRCAKELASLAEIYVNDAFGTAPPRPCLHGRRGRLSPRRLRLTSSRRKSPSWAGALADPDPPVRRHPRRREGLR